MLTHTPETDPFGRSLPGSEYIGENRIRVYLSQVVGQWESKQPLLDLMKMVVAYHLPRMPNAKPTLSLVNSFSVSEIDTEMVAAALAAFEQAVREFRPDGG